MNLAVSTGLILIFSEYFTIYFGLKIQSMCGWHGLLIICGVTNRKSMCVNWLSWDNFVIQDKIFGLQICLSKNRSWMICDEGIGRKCPMRRAMAQILTNNAFTQRGGIQAIAQWEWLFLMWLKRRASFVGVYLCTPRWSCSTYVTDFRSQRSE